MRLAYTALHPTCHQGNGVCHGPQSPRGTSLHGNGSLQKQRRARDNAAVPGPRQPPSMLLSWLRIVSAVPRC